ncbi:MAG: PilN domain-containing protein [Peptostreptococcaceae bacterium]|nr:PilN domain-containing protein [Peptostreptococcaceae bacterium]
MNKFNFSHKMPSNHDYFKKEINLLPEDYNNRKKKNIKFFSYIAICVIFIGAMVGYNYYLQKTIDNKISQKALIESKIAELTETENEQELILLLNSKIEVKSKAIMTFELISPKIIPILNTLENNLPAGLSFSSFDKTEEQMTIDGIADSQKTVAEFLHNLKAENLFESVVVESIYGQVEENGSNSYFYFTMQCKFKNEGGEDNDSL